MNQITIEQLIKAGAHFGHPTHRWNPNYHNYISMKNAIEDSGLEEKDISNEMTGIIVGSGGPSTQNLLKSFIKYKN